MEYCIIPPHHYSLHREPPIPTDVSPDVIDDPLTRIWTSKMNEISGSAFPELWPEGCPPTNAANCDGAYFHLVGQDPPGTDDLKSFAERGRTLRSVPPCPCMPYGLSVFADRNDVLHMHRAMPRLGRFVAMLQLRAEHGKILLTPGQRPSHHTWWPCSDCVRGTCVEKIECVVL